MTSRQTLANYVAQQRQSKSTRGNIRTEIDGLKFASKAEAKRYCELKLLQQTGKIFGLQCHPKLDLDVNGMVVCRYTPDFAYSHACSSLVIYEDVKGKMEEAAWVRIRLARALGFTVRVLDTDTDPRLFGKR